MPKPDDPAMWATTLVCAVGCIALVAAERQRNEARRRAAKVVASCAFVATALLAVQSAPASGGFASFQLWAVIGLELGLIGDVALLSERRFILGLAAFLAGHIAYAIAVAKLLPPSAWLASAGWVAALPVVLGLVVLASLWKRLDHFAGPVTAYVATITAMVIATVAAARAGVTSPSLAIGASLLFASDLAVARQKFVAPDFANKAWGLPAYYAAQLFIAWSLGFPR